MDESVERYIVNTEPSSSYFLKLYENIADVILVNNIGSDSESKNLDYFYQPMGRGLSIDITPKNDYGFLKPFEKMNIIESDGHHYLEYMVSGKIVFRFGINDYSKKLISKFYKFRSSNISSNLL